MKRASAVIGANFGDEGKGLVTDYLSNVLGPNTAVVRFNGGAQAGHTVVTPLGERHVFHHFSSGSFCGASTCLSKHFIVNPMIWHAEMKQIIDHTILPDIYVDFDCMVTTPYDMIINQALETHRNQYRHGSCGVGINETIVRNMKYPLYVRDIEKPEFFEKVEEIRTKYLPERMLTLGISGMDEYIENLTSTNSLTKAFVAQARFFERLAFRVSIPDYLSQQRFIIFEGAQGLLLDEEHEFFPHVTRSKTGLRNIISISEQAGINFIDAAYVTRSYMTRHGNGPFPTEDKNLKFEDNTNIPHDFQGALRFGHLDFPLIRNSIEKDLKEANKNVFVTSKLAVTHLDQTPDIDPRDIFTNLGMDQGYLINGPTRKDVTPSIVHKATIIRD